MTARHRVGKSAAPYGAADGEGEGEGVTNTPPRRPRWAAREVFVREIVGQQADSGLRAELLQMAPDTTDEVPVE